MLKFVTDVRSGNAANLLTRDQAGNPIALAFNTKTFDFEASNVQTFKNKHVVTYGGNFRHNTFDISLGYNTGQDLSIEYLRNIGVFFTVNNIFDRDPPFGYGGRQNPFAYVPFSINPLGRWTKR